MNIFEIEESLMELYTQIEENDGELTDEIAEQLEITQENLKDKIKAYIDVIKEINGSLESTKCEQNRLKSLETSKKKAKENLSNIIANAVTMFGDTTKSGGKFFDYGTGKVSVRSNNVCEVDDNKTDLINNALMYYVKHNNYGHSNVIDCSLTDIIKSYIYNTRNSQDKLNSMISGEEITVDSENIPTVADIDNIEFNINLSIPLSAILDNTEDTEILFKLAELYDFKTKCNMSKSGIKDNIINGDVLSNFAKIKETKSITIK